VGCGCGKRELFYKGAGSLKQARPVPNDDGEVALGGDYCGTLYTGASRNATVFIVGYGTDSETVFKRADRKEAIAMARDSNLTIDQIYAGTLCHDAMVSLHGS